ncbi:hypothetical protein CFE70_001310 [Pyrenophora teres f. teres 0-1]
MKSSRTASSYEDMDVEEEPEVLRHGAREVRGIWQLDLLASPEVAAAVTKALKEARRPRVHFQVGETRSGETIEVQQAEASSDEDESIEEVVQRLYDWSSGETAAMSEDRS